MSEKVFDILKKWGVKDYKIIDKQAIKEINLGASILATGGGGDPEIGLLWTYNVLDAGKTIVMVDPLDVPDDVVAASCACLGAPVVLTERPPSHDVLNKAIMKLQQYTGKELELSIPLECGGVNSTVAYAAAAAFDIPVVDVDGMNRAFPELQMTSWATSGVQASPTVSCDERGNITVFDTGDDNKLAEDIARRTAMAYGGNSWIATYMMNGKQMKETSVMYSQSIAWELGKAVFKARENHLDPVEEMLKSLEETRNVKGMRVFKGKIIDINREFGGEATKGFSSGRLTIEGIEEYKGSKAEIDFQNEWLNLRIDGETRCLPPDLIAIVDSETGEPIRSDIVKYGYRGSIILIPAHERMKTPKAIETFGPRYFGYDCDYVPVEELNKGVK